MNGWRIDPARADRAVDIVAVLLAISVALALAALTWRIVAGGGRDHVAAAPPPPAYPAVDITPVVQLAPFGTPGSGGAASGPTSLPLVLKAIFYREASGASTALVAANGQPAKPIAAGESAGGLATVASIERDHVVLNVGGQLQQLFFPGKMKALLGQAQPGQAQPTPPPVPAPPSTPAASPAAPPSPQSIAPGSLPPPLPSPAPTPGAPPQPRQGAFLDSPPSPPTSPARDDRAPGHMAGRPSVQLLASR